MGGVRRDVAVLVALGAVALGLVLGLRTRGDGQFLPEAGGRLDAPPRPRSERIAAVVEHLSGAVVAVSAGARAGSGVVFEPGLVVTAARLLPRTGPITVVGGEGDRLAARRVGVDPATGLAVLRVEDRRLRPAAASDRIPTRGELVVTLARAPSGASWVAGGVVTGNVPGRLPDVPLDELAIDTTPGPRGLGAALADVDGRVVGIVTAAAPRRGSVSVPAVVASELVRRLARGEPLRFAYLGLRAEPLSSFGARRPVLVQAAGVVVVSVAARSPASAAGVRRGDVIVAAGGRRVDGVDDVVRAIVRRRPGSRLTLSLVRGGRTLTAVAGLVGRPGAGDGGT